MSAARGGGGQPAEEEDSLQRGGGGGGGGGAARAEDGSLDLPGVLSLLPTPRNNSFDYAVTVSDIEGRQTRWSPPTASAPFRSQASTDLKQLSSESPRRI
eukprot:3197320-Rhodomonas_salina.3